MTTREHNLPNAEVSITQNPNHGEWAVKNAATGERIASFDFQSAALAAIRRGHPRWEHTSEANRRAKNEVEVA